MAARYEALYCSSIFFAETEEEAWAGLECPRTDFTTCLIHISSLIRFSISRRHIG
jgi:hypothetical protein